MNKINLEELKSLSLDELLERYSLEELEKLLPIKDILMKFPDIEEDREKVESGVLLSDEIKRYVTDFKLIYPFNPDNLKAASYYLAVGDEYALGGKKGDLYDLPDKNEIKIPPFQVAIIKTKEIINLPRFLIGRWNIRVTMAYEGLLWVGGAQVDPGFVGHLFCPIYNLSDEEVVLEKGKTLLATIDFVRTTPFKKEKKNEFKTFPRDQKYKTINDYNWRLKSALFTEAAKRIDIVEKQVADFGKKLDTSIGLMATAITVLFAVLAVFVSSGSGESSLVIQFYWAYLSVIASIIAVILSIVAYHKAALAELKATVSASKEEELLNIAKKHYYITKIITIAIIITALIVIAVLLITVGIKW